MDAQMLAGPEKVLMNTVPFTVGKLYAGFGECHGLLHDEGDHLCLEFQTKDTVAGIFKSGVKRVRVPLAELASVTLTKGWLGTSWCGVKIVLQAAKMETLKDVPGMSQGRVELSIARKDRHAAEKLVADLYEQVQPID
jgi:hypothetical protein